MKYRVLFNIYFNSSVSEWTPVHYKMVGQILIKTLCKWVNEFGPIGGAEMVFGTMLNKL